MMPMNDNFGPSGLLGCRGRKPRLSPWSPPDPGARRVAILSFRGTCERARDARGALGPIDRKAISARSPKARSRSPFRPSRRDRSERHTLTFARGCRR